MSGINRYESFVAAAYGGPYAAMRPSDSGDWVGFTEHEAEVARLRAEIYALKDDPSYETACETIRKLRAELQNAAKAALDAVELSCEKEREADALRAEDELAARQPVGEPVEHACTNCDRTDEVVICQTCAGMAWDNGRLHEFHEVRELSTSLGEGVLDHLLPDEWHEKPLLRFHGAFDEGDRSVGIGERCGNVLAADQSGTVLGDYLAARAAKEGGQ